MSRSIMIIAGEASGDLHAAEVVQAIQASRPAIKFFGIAGPKMRASGVEALIKAEDISLMGFAEVLMSFKLVWQTYQTIKQALKRRKPDLLILIDYPGFNLRIAKLAKRAGIKVLYYISPQIWAWRQGRIKQIKRYVDHMAVIFPFEEQFYREYNVPVTYVGCPLLDELNMALTQIAARERLGLDPSKTTITLLPGSRYAVVARGLPTMLQAAKKLVERVGEVQFIIPIAATLTKEKIVPLLQSNKLTVKLVEGRSDEAMKAADAMICSSGTATLEAALLGVPMVVVYKMNEISYQIIKRLIKIKLISLCNIVAKKKVVKELLQQEASADNIADEMYRLLTDKSYQQTMKSEFVKIREQMGSAGAAEKVAQLVFSLLGDRQ